jgi:hypothetical protein
MMMMMQVEIYKTNVQEAEEATMLRKKLLEHFPDYRINFDLEDRDRILRIRAMDIRKKEIVFLVKDIGFNCELLD